MAYSFRNPSDGIIKHYFINCQIAFYDQIKQIKQGPRHFTGHPSHETE